MRVQTLVLGDAFVLALVTVIGFSTHGEAGAALFPRMLTTFIPLLLGWFCLAPFLGLFRAEVVADARQLWRPALVMLFGGPFAALLRAFALNTTVIPIFAVVLGGTSALGLLLWRTLCWFLQKKK